MTNFSTVSTILFENDAFWQMLGTKTKTYPNALGRIHSLLSVSRTLRSELLEVPVATSTATKQATKKRKRSAPAADLIFKQPNSIFHRAIHNMFAFDPANGFFTTLSPGEAARQFAMTVRDVCLIIRIAAKDPNSEGHAAAEAIWRVTIPTMLRAAVERKGGLGRIAVAQAARRDAQAKALAKLVPEVSQAVQTLFMPLLAKVRDVAKQDKKRDKNKRIVDNYGALKRSTKLLDLSCQYHSEFTSHCHKSHTSHSQIPSHSQPKALGGRKMLASHLSTAKMHAKRLEAAYSRMLRTKAASSAAKAAALLQLKLCGCRQGV
jgi:hypothetical protein